MANLKKSKEMGDFGFKVKRKKHVPKHDEGLAIWMKIKDVDRLRQIADEEEVSLTGAASLVIQFWIEHHRQKKRRPVCEEEDKDNPHSSEEDPDYQAFTVKEEASTENSDTEEFTQIVEPVDESPGEDGNLVVGWKEEGDDRADEEVPSGDPVGTIQKEDISGSSADGIDGDKRVAQTSDGGEFEVVKCFIKEEPTDSDYAEENEEDAEGGFAVMPQALGGKGSNRGALSSEHHHSGPSTSRFEPDTQGEASASGMSWNPYLVNSGDRMRASQQMSGDTSHDRERHLDFPPAADLGTQSDSSQSSMSEYWSSHMRKYAPSFDEQSYADAETLGLGSAHHADGRRNAAGSEDFDDKCEQIPDGDLARTFLPSAASKDSLFEPSHNLTVPSATITKDMNFHCGICNDSFSDRSLLREHMLTHTLELVGDSQEDSLQCNICGKTLSSKQSLSFHMRTHTGEKPFQCPICGKAFSHSGNCRTHMKTHGNVKPFVCSVCDKGFTMKHQLQGHMRTHTGEKPFECTVCGARYARKDGLSCHMKSHTGQNLHYCPVCGKSFKQKTYMLVHLRTHTGDKPYQCHICEKSFSQHSNLNKHLQYHSGEKPFSCSYCDKTFSLKQTLKHHEMVHTDDRPHQCTVCDKRFTRPYALNEHMRTHRQKALQAPETNAMDGGKSDMNPSGEDNSDGLSASNLAGRMEPLIEEKRFQCTVCQKTFSRNRYLTKHMVTHSDEKPYECSVCNKSFTLRHHLKKHMTIHTGEKEFECSICSKKFARDYYLKEHMKIHTGEKPYECDECGSRFSHGSTLYKHKRTHTGEKPFICLVCGRDFAHSNSLLKHSKIHEEESQTGVDQSGVDQIGLDQTGVDQIGLDQTGVDQSGVDQIGVDQKGVDQIGVDQIGVDQTGVDHTDVDQIGVDQIGVDQTCVEHTGVE